MRDYLTDIYLYIREQYGYYRTRKSFTEYDADPRDQCNLCMGVLNTSSSQRHLTKNESLLITGAKYSNCIGTNSSTRTTYLFSY